MNSESTPSELDRPRSLFVVARWLLRILLSVSAVLIFAQPVTIGQYLQGRFTMLAVHAGIADGVVVATFVAGFGAIFYSMAGGRVWVAIAVPLLGLLAGIQIGMGYAHELGIHVPLGVTIVAATLFLTGWAWSPSSGRFRRRRDRNAEGRAHEDLQAVR